MAGERNHSNWWQFDANYKAPPRRTSPPFYRTSDPTRSSSTATTTPPPRFYGDPPQPDTEMYSVPREPFTNRAPPPTPPDLESQTWGSRLVSLSSNQVLIGLAGTCILYAIIFFVAQEIYTEIPEPKLFTPVGGGPEMDWRGVVLASMPKNNLWAVLLWFLGAAGLVCLELAAMWGVLATLPLKRRRLIWMLQPFAFVVITVLLGAILYGISTWL